MAMASALLITPIPPAKTHQPCTSDQRKPSSSLLLKKTRTQSFRIHALQETREETKPTPQSSSSAEEATAKYGLEFGLWKIFSSKGEGEGKSKTDQAKELLTKYGGAYLITSITLSLISFSLCYVLIGAGIDVQSLLSKIGIVTDETGGKVGTVALAYAAHKAASPIRFPPTVALTPVVAGWIGKKADEKTDN
ncbi:Uncharacterized protein M6B38_214100 [Iris pallida]|uniref:DUF1279 domain-containing protein n=1 Tax=Iris pallida TaxID=29817 RepID=A0AAX6E2B7_IRIPA|nr:Uncharacterized protein M6B38_214100 [Iris pallida]